MYWCTKQERKKRHTKLKQTLFDKKAKTEVNEKPKE
jgi:hypothetical protein